MLIRVLVLLGVGGVGCGVMFTTELFERADDEFFKYGIDEADVGDSVGVERVREWFDLDGVDEFDGEFYWVKAPFVFVGVEWISDVDVEYNVFEPELSRGDMDAIELVLDGGFVVDTSDVGRFVESVERELSEVGGVDVSSVDCWRVSYALLKKKSREGELYPFVVDDNVVELSVQSGERVVVSIREPTYQKDVVTNVELDFSEFSSVFNRFESRASESIGPVMRGYDGSKLQFQLSETSTGKLIHIEFYDDASSSVTELISTGMLDVSMGAFLWFAVESERNILVSGSPNSGRTTFLRALFDFTPLSSRVLAVGDGRELVGEREYLQHYSWESFESDEELKMLSNMMPSYMVFDDISSGFGVEPMFAAMQEGKTVWASIAGDSIDSTIYRLTNPPIDAPGSHVQLFNLMIPLADVTLTDEETGRLSSEKRVEKIGEVEAQDKGFRVSEAYHRDAQRDEFVEDIENSKMLEIVRHSNGWTHSELVEKFSERKLVLSELVECGVFDSPKVQAVLAKYRSDGEWLMTELEDESVASEDVFEQVFEEFGVE